MSDPIDGPPRPDPSTKPPANPEPPPRRQDPVVEVSITHADSLSTYQIQRVIEERDKLQAKVATLERDQEQIFSLKRHLVELDNRIQALEQDLGIESNKAELLAEDIESVHMFLDDLKVPRDESEPSENRIPIYSNSGSLASDDNELRDTERYGSFVPRKYSIVGRIKVLLDHHVGDVCLCGCDMGDHEQYEEGISCSNDDHQCYLVWPAVAELYQGALQEVLNWTDTARHHAKNEEFWRGLVHETGELLGIACKTSDDGSVQQDVLGLKVPELVRGLVGELAHVDEVLARRPALDKQSRTANIEHCIETAALHDKVQAELDSIREGAGQMVDNLSAMSAVRDIECQAWRDQAPHGAKCASRHCGDCGGKGLTCCPDCDCYRAALIKEYGHE